MSETKRKHTPEPLRTSRTLTGDIELVSDKDGAVMATVYGDDNDPQCWPVTANAERLALCYNSHESLRAELAKLTGPKCTTEECPDYDGEHPYHDNVRAQAWEKAQKEVRRLKRENDSRQRSIEILGKAIGEVLPEFRASGTGEEHSAACGAALISEVKRLRKRLAACLSGEE